MANEKALNAWLAKKARIDAIIARLQQSSADHFDTNPEEINWSHVGNLQQIEDAMQYASDRFFSEGEYAPEA